MRCQHAELREAIRLHSLHLTKERVAQAASKLELEVENDYERDPPGDKINLWKRTEESVQSRIFTRPNGTRCPLRRIEGRCSR